MLNERPEGTVETICPVDQKPCEGQGTDVDCDKCTAERNAAQNVAKVSSPLKAAYEKVREQWNGFTHWNYRVVRTVDFKGNVEYGVYECYWAEDKMISRTEEPVTNTYDTLEDLRRDAEAILAALNDEVLEDEP